MNNIVISSILPATPETIWPLLLRTETLRYIAAPYAKFVAVNRCESDDWREGMTADFRLWVFGFIPLGIHTIQIQKIDPSTRVVKSEEKNRMVPVWNHTIRLEVMDAATTCYTDEIEISAGWLTQLVRLWARAFYKHRQKKWILLLNQAR